MANSKNPPPTFLEALLPFRRRAVDGKDGRPITDEERKWLELEIEDAAGENLYSSGAARCRVYRDEDGTPCVYTAWSYTIPAWSHAMSWPLFQGWQNAIEALIIEYEGGRLSVYGGFPEQLDRARVRLDELQPHLPLFLGYMQHVPGLPEGALVELIQDAAADAHAGETRPMSSASELEDLSAFIPASDIAVDEYAPSFKALWKVLKKHPEIRRRKPLSQRLEVHAGDWNKYKRERDRALDDPSVGALVKAQRARATSIHESHFRSTSADEE